MPSYRARTAAYVSASKPYRFSALKRLAGLVPATETTATFQYRPLEPDRREIRILELLPRTLRAGKEKQLITCTIRHVSLDDQPVYLGLSYTWGDATVKRPILLEGRIFYVTENLLSALEHLQRQWHSLALWIDAVCINQNDNVEKSSQVGQMGNIYREAALVLAWLGPAAGDSDLAIESLDYLGRKLFEMPDGPCLQERYELFSKLFSPETTPQFPVDVVCSLFRRAWWDRVWVVQEVTLAKDVLVVCGDADIPFHFLNLAHCALYELRLLSAAFNGALDEAVSRVSPQWQTCDPRVLEAATLGHNQDAAPLKSRVLTITGLKATDPRDHVLGLLGMASDTEELNIHADYSKSCQVTYTDLARGFLEAQEDLQILSRCKFPKQQSNLPSWVPDWSMRCGHTFWDPKHSPYNASRQSLAPRGIAVSGNTLRLAGARYGTVSRVGGVWSIDYSSAGGDALLHCFAEIGDFVHSDGFAYPSEHDKQEAVWRTPIADAEYAIFGEEGRYNRRATPELLDAFVAYRGAVDASPVEGTPNPSAIMGANPCIRFIPAILDGRRIFTLPRGT